MAWSAEDIPDLSDRVAVVTGANSGLGFETSLELARHKAHVVLACRDEGRGQAALDRIVTAVPGSSLELSLVDLGDLASIRKFAEAFIADRRELDILVNNAGVMALPERRTTVDGFEMQFGVNHLGQFALTGLLLPALLQRPAPRVVAVTSFAHRYGAIRFDDLHTERRYRKWIAYGDSKLANVLFTFELDRRARAAEADLVAAVAHPGFAATHLQDDTSFGPLRVFAQSGAQGALPILYAATAPGVRGGQFFGPLLFGLRGPPRRARTARRGRNGKVARRLWEVSEELTGVTYDFTPSEDPANR